MFSQFLLTISMLLYAVRIFLTLNKILQASCMLWEALTAATHWPQRRCTTQRANHGTPGQVWPLHEPTLEWLLSETDCMLLVDSQVRIFDRANPVCRNLTYFTLCIAGKTFLNSIEYLDEFTGEWTTFIPKQDLIYHLSLPNGGDRTSGSSVASCSDSGSLSEWASRRPPFCITTQSFVSWIIFEDCKITRPGLLFLPLTRHPHTLRWKKNYWCQALQESTNNRVTIPASRQCQRSVLVQLFVHLGGRLPLCRDILKFTQTRQHSDIAKDVFTSVFAPLKLCNSSKTD